MIKHHLMILKISGMFHRSSKKGWFKWMNWDMIFGTLLPTIYLIKLMRDLKPFGDLVTYECNAKIVGNKIQTQGKKKKEEEGGQLRLAQFN